MSEVNEDDGRSNESEPESNYRVKVSGRFLLLSVVASVLLAFSVGRAARLILLEAPRHAFLTAYRQSTLRERPIGGIPHYESPLPFLVAKEGETIPHTRYTSKTFDTSKSTMMSSWLITNRNAHGLEEGQDDSKTCDENVVGGDESESLAAKKIEAIAGIIDEREISQPTGEHLMVDIKNVDGNFLNSEHRLARAMIDVIRAANLTLLSYHCHGMEPSGVSCVGILLYNYIAFHTWPNEGVITFDLVAGDGTSILPVLPVIEERFGVPRPFSSSQPSVRWAHKLRGFHRYPTDISNLFEITDLGASLLSLLGTEFKEEVATIETEFQRIDIYDVIFQRTGSIENYRKTLFSDDSYESHHKSLFRPDRVIFLDGWIQSSLKFEAAYHEALVHPAMFAHSNPKRIAIVGGGEGATLREVLKHNTVQTAFMIDIDEQMVIESRKSIPEWSDCSDLEGSAPWCGDDSRARVYYEDAHAWFMEKYSGADAKSGDLDLVILDALDPESEVPFAQALYGNDEFMRAFFNSLSDDGIIIMQLGQAPKEYAPDEMLSRYKNRATTTKLLAKLGFESIHAYEESHCGFFAPWSYVIGFKSYKTRQRWYANLAEIDLQLHKRGVRTKSGKSPFRYFDGATMVSYQVPNRAKETVFCRRQPTPKECLVGESDYDPAMSNIPVTSFEVKKSGCGQDSGRGLFTKVDIPEGSYISAETGVHAVGFMPSTAALIKSISSEDFGNAAKVIDWYMEGYGYSSQLFGGEECFVDSSILTFVNHGCRGSYNIGEETPFDEFSADPDSLDYVSAGRSHKGTSTFNPVVDRHLRFQPDVSLREIKAGEEILDNYLDFVGLPEYWTKDVMDLRALCSGQAVGQVTNYERGNFIENDS